MNRHQRERIQRVEWLRRQHWLRRIVYFIQVRVHRIRYARIFGLRYFFDGDYRIQIRSRIKKMKYGSSFNGNKKNIRSKLGYRDGYTCRYCNGLKRGEVLTIDHIIPRAMGGSNELSNLQLLCDKCHVIKSQHEQRTTTTEGEQIKHILKKLQKEKREKRREKSAREALGTVQKSYASKVREYLLYVWEDRPGRK